MACDFACFDDGHNQPTGSGGVANALLRGQSLLPGKRSTCKLMMALVNVGIVFFDIKVVRVHILNLVQVHQDVGQWFATVE